jgi:hypothetical protein
MTWCGLFGCNAHETLPLQIETDPSHPATFPLAALSLAPPLTYAITEVEALPTGCDCHGITLLATPYAINIL